MKIADINRILNAKNIEQTIQDYLSLVKEIPLKIESDNFLGLMAKLKRDKISSGPYPEVSIFEAANRVMSDLVILFGLRDLLNHKYPELAYFEEYTVELGNEKNNAHDIISRSKSSSLAGEVFNISKSFFHGKSSTSVRKLLANQDNPEYLIILCNSDSYSFSEESLVKANKVRVIPVDFKL